MFDETQGIRAALNVLLDELETAHIGEAMTEAERLSTAAKVLAAWYDAAGLPKTIELNDLKQAFANAGFEIHS